MPLARVENTWVSQGIVQGIVQLYMKIVQDVVQETPLQQVTVDGSWIEPPEG